LQLVPITGQRTAGQFLNSDMYISDYWFNTCIPLSAYSGPVPKQWF